MDTTDTTPDLGTRPTATPSLSDTGGEGGTSTAVLDEVDASLDEPRTVVVWDDPVNLMNYVVMVFTKVFPTWTREQCETRMLEVHNRGRSAVFSGARDECELVAAKIQSFQLWVTVER